MLIIVPSYALTPTSGQLQYLQSLTDQQRQQALQLLGAPPRVAPRIIEKPTSVPENTTNPPISTDSQQKDRLEVPRLQGGDTIIVSFAAKTAINRKASDLINRPDQLFKLDQYGVINMADVGLVPVAGLTSEDAAARLMLEPALSFYEINIHLLPLTPIGKAALKPFGYELFRQAAGSLQSMSDIPVPADYIIGPGDIIYIQLFGKENQEYSLAVSREGTLAFPGIGSIPVIGLRFDELKKSLRKRVKRQFIGVNANVTLGELRSMRIFVLGEVENPGSYVVSSLASMTHVLSHAGGIKATGSLRKILLKRNGQTINTLDLYDLLLKGDTRRDFRLRSGDVVFVPTIEMQVGVTGEVVRPGLYELKDQSSIADLINIAGGVLPTAYLASTQIERVKNGKTRLIMDLDLTSSVDLDLKLDRGDVLTIRRAPEQIDNIITIRGRVTQPGVYQWKEGARLSHYLPTMDSVQLNADLDYVLIIREIRPEFKLKVFSSSLRQIFNQPNGAYDVLMHPRDTIYVFDAGEQRGIELDKIMDQLQRQSNQVEATRIVRVSGEIRFPDSYPLEDGMRISDLIRAGGQLKESAFMFEAELTRYVVKPGAPRRIEHIKVAINEALQGNAQSNILLQAYDLLHIKEIPHWAEQEHIELVGEIHFAGKYPVRRGETLRQLLQRAGGITEYAYPDGAVFIREDLRQREQQRLDEMARQLESELASISLERSGDPSQLQDAGIARQLLTRLQSTKAAGRLVIDLADILSESGANDIVLRGGDKLYVPEKMQEVTVVGEVFYPTSHLYQEDFSYLHYTDLSGGMTKKADRDNIYVIRSNGAVALANDSWFDKEVIMSQGDTVVVPLDADRMSKLKLWSSISEIAYQLGLSAAAWKTVGLFTP